MITIEEVRTVLSRVDFNNDQVIDFEEFLIICGDRKAILSDINLINLFNALDDDE